MCERVRLQEAAKELGVSQQSVREHMKQGLWDLGTCSRLKKTGHKQWEFHIYRTKLDKHMGKEAPHDNMQHMPITQPLPGAEP